MINDVYYTPKEKAQRIAYQYNAVDAIFVENKEEYTKIAEAKGYASLDEMRQHLKYNWKVFFNSNCQSNHVTLSEFRRATMPKEYGLLLTIALKDIESMPTPEKLEEKLYDEQYVFSYEYYSGKDNHLNPHIHIFMYGDHHKGNTIKKFARFFKVEKNFVDFSKKYNKLQNDNAINYVKGIKKNQEKNENIELDDNYRSKNNIKKYYTNI